MTHVNAVSTVQVCNPILNLVLAEADNFAQQPVILWQSCASLKAREHTV